MTSIFLKETNINLHMKNVQSTDHMPDVNILHKWIYLNCDKLHLRKSTYHLIWSWSQIFKMHHLILTA
jgi:hypothetical protein